MSDYELHHGDMLEVMPTLAKKSVGCVFADLPYGVTKCEWDSKVMQKVFWAQIQPLLGHACTVITTCDLNLSRTILNHCPLPFKYDLIYSKSIATGFYNANKMPLRAHELVLIFGTGKSTYRPQMRENPTPNRKGIENSRTPNNIYGQSMRKPYNRAGPRHPTSVLHMPQRNCDRGQHPTQKPVALLEWLIATYTNPGDTVLDPVMGSGTTGVACANLGRRFVGIEKDATYFAAAKARIEKAYAEAATGPTQSRLAL